MRFPWKLGTVFATFIEFLNESQTCCVAPPTTSIPTLCVCVWCVCVVCMCCVCVREREVFISCQYWHPSMNLYFFLWYISVRSTAFICNTFHQLTPRYITLYRLPTPYNLWSPYTVISFWLWIIFWHNTVTRIVILNGIVPVLIHVTVHRIVFLHITVHWGVELHVPHIVLIDKWCIPRDLLTETHFTECQTHRWLHYFAIPHRNLNFTAGVSPINTLLVWNLGH